jgi:hypothetical protein
LPHLKFEIRYTRLSPTSPELSSRPKSSRFCEDAAERSQHFPQHAEPPKSECRGIKPRAESPTHSATNKPLRTLIFFRMYFRVGLSLYRHFGDLKSLDIPCSNAPGGFGASSHSCLVLKCYSFGVKVHLPGFSVSVEIPRKTGLAGPHSVPLALALISYSLSLIGVGGEYVLNTDCGESGN